MTISNSCAGGYANARHTMIALSMLLMIAVSVVGPARANPTAADPNQTDTVYFKITGSLANLDTQPAELTFWARECEECSISGLINDQTQLYDSAQASLPLSELQQDIVYEANAVVLIAGPNGLIDRIYLTK